MQAHPSAVTMLSIVIIGSVNVIGYSNKENLFLSFEKRF